MHGWIKLHRELMEKPIWLESTPQQKTILITLLMMASHKEKEWEWKGEKFKIKPGQFITSLESIANRSGKGISIQNVRTALKRFEKYGFLTNESTNKNRLITIVNWAFYQSEEDETNKQSNKQLTSNQQATNNYQECKNEKNIKNKESRQRRTYDEDSVYFQLAKFFYGEIKKNNPNHKEPNFQTWADDIRKMIEIDNRTEEQVRYLMKWVQQDDFEMANVLSPAKLRKRFDNLAMKVKTQSKKRVNKQPNSYQPDPRDKEIAFSKWINNGGRPEDFDWTMGKGIVRKEDMNDSINNGS